LLPPQIASSLRLVDCPFLQPIFELESSSLVFGRVVLIGDAAMLARPHIGGAIVKAIEDASALASALDGCIDIADGLRAFEMERLPVGRAFVAQARKLGGYFRDMKVGNEERSARVLAETAVLDFMQPSSMTPRK
jgi:2-polyprenyl-6-methoxyphenol hydroxylase-like FAD-dependent oxidoreductase